MEIYRVKKEFILEIKYLNTYNLQKAYKLGYSFVKEKDSSVIYLICFKKFVRKMDHYESKFVKVEIVE